MKKTLFIVMAAMVSAGALTINAKDNKKKSTVASAPVQTVLVNSNDTLSYAAGVAQTNGLLPYLTQQMKVDTAYMADFKKGLQESLSKSNDPSYNAYAAGLQIASMIKDRMFPGIEGELKDSPDSLVREKFVAGFIDALDNDTTIYTQKSAASYFQAKMKANHEAKQEKLYGPNREAGKKFLAENAKKDSVITTPSGLQYKVITMGTGAKPTANQKVKVNYEGKLIDGTVFDSSYKRGEPTTFRCNQVIKGWTEALTMMPAGSTWMLYIPEDLAYGEQGGGKQIKPWSALIFKVELVSIESDEKAKEEKKVEPAKTKTTTTTTKKVSKKK